MQNNWFRSRGGFWFTLCLSESKIHYGQKDESGGRGGYVRNEEGEDIMVESEEDGKKFIKALTHYIRGYKILSNKDKAILRKYDIGRDV